MKQDKQDKELNIVKKTCKELGLTYRQLGEAIGYSESSLNSIASTGNISEPIKKAIGLYLENIEQKKQLQQVEQLKIILKNLIN